MAHIALTAAERQQIDDMPLAKAPVAKSATERRHRRRKLIRCPDLFEAMIEGFEAGWSPQQSAVRMRLEGLPRSVSHCVHSTRRSLPMSTRRTLSATI